MVNDEKKAVHQSEHGCHFQSLNNFIKGVGTGPTYKNVDKYREEEQRKPSMG